MNACPRGENPKQYSFLCLIYVNHESFHKWNKRYCERLLLPGHARADSPTQSILQLTLSARTREHAHRHFFFFFLHSTISSNCQRVLWSNCSRTPWNVQPGDAMAAAHCHICNITMADVRQRSVFGSVRPYRKQKANFVSCAAQKNENPKTFLVTVAHTHTQMEKKETLQKVKS